MLKHILSISGKSGLYKLLSKSKATLIVESLIDNKRLPIHSSREKAISLSDISIFTENDEKPLWEVFVKLKEKENGEKASIDPKNMSPDDLREYLASVLPDFDREKVYPSDIRKLVTWYNLLIDKGYTEFEPEDKKTETMEETPSEEENLEI